jgi:glycogen(starch) synthase
LKIAFISYEYPPDTGFGGIGTYTWQIAKAMALQNCEVEVFTASHTRALTERIDQVTIHRIKITNQNEFNHAIVAAFENKHLNNKFDIIECAENGANAINIIKKYPNITLVVRLHTPGVLVTRMQNTYVPLIVKLRFVLGSLLRCKMDLGFWSKHDKNQGQDVEYLITKQAKLITAPSESLKKWAFGFWGIDPHKIAMIPNPYLPSEAFLNIPIENTNKTITFYGRLNVLKGCVPLTHAIKKVLKKHPDWRFKIVGKNENSHIANVDMKSWMQSELKNYKSKIEFIEWLDYKEIPTLLRESAICVFPSLFESFSYTCCESMSAGRAVVGSKNGGMNELLASNCGLLVNPKHPRAIADAICKFIENPELRTTCGAQAREKVINEYNLEKIGRVTFKNFSSLIAR